MKLIRLKKVKAVSMGLLLLMVSACSESSESDNAPKDSATTSNVDKVGYTIVKEEHNPQLKKGMTYVELEEKCDKERLGEIAAIIRSSHPEFERHYIYHYIKGQSIDGIAWATTHFSPNFEIEIVGSTSDEDAAISESSNTIEGDIIGQWKSDKSLAGAVITIYKDSSGTLFEQINYKNGQGSARELTLDGENKYAYKEDLHGEYYMIESNGNLGMYGTNGKFDEAVKQ